MDWAELNPDLLRVIAKKVSDISDFVRLRAVCKQWRAIVHPSDLPPQLPYFIKCTKKNDSSLEIKFCSLFAEKTHTLLIQISPLNGEPILYSSLTGYVLLSFSESWLLLNPLTGFQVPLPFGLDNWCHPLYFGPSYNPRPNPVERDIDVMFEFSDIESPDNTHNYVVHLWRYADRKWTKITKVHCTQDEFVRYTNGRLYVFSVINGDIRVIDATNGEIVTLIPDSSVKIHYIMEAHGGVLGVHYRPRPSTEGFLIDLYQIKDAGTNPHWAKENGIGDRMMFFDSDNNCLCLEAADFEGCKGGCIYTMDPLVDNHVLRYDMESSTKVKLYPDPEFQWFMPQTHWFVPSLF